MDDNEPTRVYPHINYEKAYHTQLKDINRLGGSISDMARDNTKLRKRIALLEKIIDLVS